MRRLGMLLYVWLIMGIYWSVSPSMGYTEGDHVQVEKVEVRVSAHGPVVLLRIDNQAIPIFVDPTVAGSIQGALTGQKFKRPLSHDLMYTIMKAYGGRVDRVVVTLKDRIYYAELTVTMNGQTNVFDSRSSDAIALAIHFQAPILVEKDLLDSAGKPLEEESDSHTLL